jgi:hypothetical protein
MGETAAIGRVYVENCNGHGVWVNGAGPGRIEHLTTFDNALAGLYATSEKSGGTNGNSLGFLEIQHISGDNNAWVVLNRQGPAMSIGYLKNEDGLSAQRGRPKKGQVCIEAWGWVNIYAAQVTHAINGASGPAFVVNSTANKSRLRVEQYSMEARQSERARRHGDGLHLDGAGYRVNLHLFRAYGRYQPQLYHAARIGNDLRGV